MAGLNTVVEGLYIRAVTEEGPCTDCLRNLVVIAENAGTAGHNYLDLCGWQVEMNDLVHLAAV